MLRAFIAHAFDAFALEIVDVLDCAGVRAEIRREPADALIIDGRLPGDPIATIAHVVACAPSTAVFVLAALGEEATARAAIAAGARGILSRPLRLAQLHDVVSALSRT